MTLGDKLKQLRLAKDWTQPEASGMIGIEQSYLSKLENDKSIPSDEMFAQLLKGYEVSVHELIGDLTEAEREKLSDISAVGIYVATSKSKAQQNSDRWTKNAIISIVLGVGLVMSGQMAIFFPNTQYEYAYTPATQNGTPERIFKDKKTEVWRLLDEKLIDKTEAKQRIDNLNAGIVIGGMFKPQYLTTWDYRGTHFSIKEKNTTKVYQLINDHTMDVWHNKVLMILGLMSMVAGALMIALMRKWRV